MNRAEAHKLLEIPIGTTKENIKKAYRQMASIWHPDKHMGASAVENATKKFQKIKEAYEFLESGKADQYTPPPRGSHKDFAETTWGTYDDLHGYSSFKRDNRPPVGDINEPYMDNWSSSGPGASKGTGRVINATISVTIEEAFTGCTKTIAVPDNHSISGQPTLIIVPPGMEESKPVRTIEAHNATVKVWIKIISDYKINWGYDEISKNGDLLKPISISPFIMMAGGFMEVATIEGGKVSVRIPAGLSPSALLKIKGKGYWQSEKCQHRGDCYLRVIPNIQRLDDIDPAELNAFVEEVQRRKKEKEQ